MSEHPDCLILGFHASNFPKYVEMVRAMGATSGAYRDLNLAFIEHQGVPMTSMDILNLFHFEGRDTNARFHNCDFLSPAIAQLGTCLHRAGLSFAYVNLPHLEHDELVDKLIHDNPLTVAITTTLYVSPHPIFELIETIRRHNKSTRIVVGGPYIYNQSRMHDQPQLEQLFAYLNADIYVIEQAGETALVNLVRTLKDGRDLCDVENIAYRCGGSYVRTKSVREENPIETCCPDYDCFSRARLGEFMSISTARSCPFACAFCGFPQRAGAYRYLDVDRIERELDRLRDLGVTTLTFLDDTFNVPKRRFREILRMMIRRQYGFRWNSFYRVDHGNEEAIALMAAAGCEGVFIGVESGSDEILALMNKGARRQHYIEAIPMLRRYGISTHANFIVGFPGETEHTALQSLEIIQAARPDFFRAQLWYADPVTPVWQHREELGVKGVGFHWSHHTMDAATAADLVDYLFLAVNDSIWLPQNGFEQWSTFYLQRKGMSLDRIKEFLRYFQAACKDKLLYPRRGEVPKQLLDGMRFAAQFDRSTLRPATDCLELYSGSRYLEIEHAICFDHAPSEPFLDAAAIEPEPGDWDAWDLSCDLAFTRLIDTTVAREYAPADLLLALFAIVAGHWANQESVDVLVAASKPKEPFVGAVPLSLAPQRGLSLAEFVESCANARRDATLRALPALAVARSPLRQSNGFRRIYFALGFAVEPADASQLRAALDLHPYGSNELNLVLTVSPGGDRLTVSNGSSLHTAVTRRIVDDLHTLCALGARALDMPISELVGTLRGAPATVAADAAERFNLGAD